MATTKQCFIKLLCAKATTFKKWHAKTHSERYLKLLIFVLYARETISKWQRLTHHLSIWVLELSGRARVKKRNVPTVIYQTVRVTLAGLSHLIATVGTACVLFFPYYSSLITICSFSSTCYLFWQWFCNTVLICRWWLGWTHSASMLTPEYKHINE